MDISLIAYNKKNNTLTYAGANNNLYLVRNGILKEYIADKMPVGRYLVNKEFSEYKIEIEKGDLLYIFTDGFADQFGGPNTKKFKYSAFKEMFEKVSHIPIEQQREAINTILEDWMGAREQIDDICVIGIQV